MSVKHYLAVGLGGGLGAILRVMITSLLPQTVFGIPIMIISVNVLGCFIVGYIFEKLSLSWNLSNDFRAFLIPGLLGGFTTFSAFVVEIGLLLKKQQLILAMIYSIMSVILSIIFFYIGIKASSII